MSIHRLPRRPPHVGHHPALICSGLGILLLAALPAMVRALPLVFVTEKHSNAVDVIDAATNTVTATACIGQSPSEIAAAPSGRFVYAVNAGDESNSVSVIDVTQVSNCEPMMCCRSIVTDTIPVGKEPLGVVFAPDGTRAYVTNAGDNSVAVIDVRQQAVPPATITVGASPAGLAITPDGQFVYVANAQNLNTPAAGTVSVIDTATKTVLTTVSVGKNPFAVAVTPDGRFAYVVNSSSLHTTEQGSVSIIDTGSQTVVNTIPVGFNPLGIAIAITPNGATTAYVTDFSDDTVHVIDVATQTVTTVVNVGRGPLGIAFTPDGRFVYVANRQPFNFADTGDMSVIDTARNAVVATIPVGSNPTGVAVVGAPTSAVCPGDCDGDGTVTINELLLSVNIALGTASLQQCSAADSSGDGTVTVNELLAAVTASLDGCPL